MIKTVILPSSLIFLKIIGYGIINTNIFNTSKSNLLYEVSVLIEDTTIILFYVSN